jgi:hypothetical protein
MTRALAAVLLGGPVVLAFLAGGFFPIPRAVAAVLACLVLAATAFAVPLRAPRAGWVAAGALLALAGWTGLSVGWAPLAGPALADTERLVLYAAAFTAGLLVLGRHRAAVAPAVAAGCLVVVGTGVLSRTLPWLVDLDPSRMALGRLDQPITYWNAMGLVAALGIVLAAALAVEPHRAAWLRRAALAGGVALVPGLLLTFSRGALGAAAAGLVVLVLLAPTRAHVRAALLIVALGALAAIPALVFDGVRAHADGGRAGEGAIALAWLVALAALGGRLAREPDHARLHRHLRSGLAAAALVAVAALAVAVSGEDRASPAAGTTAKRFTTVQTTRGDYWEVAAGMAADAPLRGDGAGSFRVHWARERPYVDGARDAHSLYLETLAELGLVGLGLLAAFLIAVAIGVRASWRADALAAAGPAAALVAFALHAGLDWDWELPAVTLPALALAAAQGSARTTGSSSR